MDCEAGGLEGGDEGLVDGGRVAGAVNEDDRG